MRRFLPLFALVLLGREQRDRQGWVYSNRNNLADDIPIGAF
ncbi:MAG TPA: hypothetical protein VFH89_10515 [Sphingomicrobium sp.]|nr:hypothetical protein [Sphingomicrobium sp.]